MYNNFLQKGREKNLSIQKLCFYPASHLAQFSLKSCQTLIILVFFLFSTKMVWYFIVKYKQQWKLNFSYKLISLRSWKAGKFEKMLSLGNSHPFVTRGYRVSRAPPHHTSPRFSKSSWYVFLTIPWNVWKLSGSQQEKIFFQALSNHPLAESVELASQVSKKSK